MPQGSETLSVQIRIDDHTNHPWLYWTYATLLPGYSSAFNAVSYHKGNSISTFNRAAESPSILSTIDAAMEHSPLSRLPGELRNKIYDYVLYKPEGIPVVAIHYSTTEVWPDGISAQRNRSKLGWQDRKPRHLGLPRTCKAMRHETIGLYFRVNHVVDFSADSTFSGLELERQIHHWAAIIGPENARRVRHFRCTVQQPIGGHGHRLRAKEIVIQYRSLRYCLSE